MHKYCSNFISKIEFDQYLNLLHFKLKKLKHFFSYSLKTQIGTIKNNFQSKTSTCILSTIENMQDIFIDRHRIIMFF
jgi:hypothetical protein